MALRQARLAEQVIGFVRRPASVAEACRLGAVDVATTDLDEAVTAADLVIFCTPLGQMAGLARAMGRSLRRGALVTDVGSVKVGVLRELGPLVGRAGGRFVGSHPMAGGEKPGMESARADLFQGALCVVTPVEKTSASALREVKRFWRELGCRVRTMSPEMHDVFVSRSSHLPQLLAAQLTQVVLDPGHPPGQRQLCASGFRDTTRIASGSPEMWRDIAMANRRHLGKSLDVCIRGLTQVREALRRGDEAALMDFFQTAKDQRDRWMAGSAAGSSD